MVYEANVNKTLHYIKYCLLNNISKVYQYIRQPDILYIPGSYFLDKLDVIDKNVLFIRGNDTIVSVLNKNKVSLKETIHLV